MAKLKARISKADFDGLDEAIQGFYVADGEDFKLDSDHEDVTGLKNKNRELLEKVKGLKAFEGMNADEVKAKLAQLEEQETASKVAQGKWEELETRLKAKHEAELQAATSKYTTLVQRTAAKDLELALIGAGVKKTMAEDLAISLTTKSIKHVADDNGGIVWKTMDDTETIDLSKYIPGLKENGKADYFESTLGTGSGASGSEGGNTSTKTMPEAQFDALSPREQAAFISSGGQPV